MGVGDKPTFVLTRRELARTQDTLEFYDTDVALHLAGVKAYESGMVELRYEVRRR
jgi:hypothetical protein